MACPLVQPAGWSSRYPHFLILPSVGADCWTTAPHPGTVAHPVEGINGESRTEEILAVLKSYGISKDGVELWGTGTPLREFLWSEEMADASVFIMEHVDFKDTLSIVMANL